MRTFTSILATILLAAIAGALIYGAVLGARLVWTWLSILDPAHLRGLLVVAATLLVSALCIAGALRAAAGRLARAATEGDRIALYRAVLTAEGPDLAALEPDLALLGSADVFRALRTLREARTARDRETARDALLTAMRRDLGRASLTQADRDGAEVATEYPRAEPV